MVLLAIGCRAETRYRVLTIFFEGVPEPGSIPETPEQRTGSGDRLENPVSFHASFREERCTECHVRKKEAALLAPIPDLCWRCHPRPLEGDPWNHAPARVGACLACHVGHEAATPDLLTTEGKTLCYGCHRASYVEALAGHQAVDLERCATCHRAHEGGTRVGPAKTAPRDQPMPRAVEYRPVRLGLSSAATGTSLPSTAARWERRVGRLPFER